jgi:hypothetical protein
MSVDDACAIEGRLDETGPRVDTQKWTATARVRLEVQALCALKLFDMEKV